jgi:hypothetical protein
MGMFDWVEFEGNQYQSKDTPRQLCDNYKIDGLGQLWVEEYDAEWISDSTSLFGGHINQSNQHWAECRGFSGPLRFYREDKESGGYQANAWIEYLAEFKNGFMIDLKLLEGEQFIEWYKQGIEDKGLK